MTPKRANIPVRKLPIHDKVFIVDGKYGDAYEHLVYTGSHNLSGSAKMRDLAR
jgi:phosphatidylserine/phosphatidylglycerophosphate/cardiolipin synthase-like enzyme